MLYKGNAVYEAHALRGLGGGVLDVRNLIPLAKRLFPEFEPMTARL